MRNFLLILSVLLCQSAAARSADTLKACGFVSDISGKAQIERLGKKYDVKGLEGILETDVISVEKGSSIAINLCGMLKKSNIPGPAKTVIADCTPKLQSGKMGKQPAINGDLCWRLTKSSINVVTRRKLIYLAEFQGGVVYVGRGGEDDPESGSNYLYESWLKPEFCKGDLERPTDLYVPSLERPFFNWAPVEGAKEYIIDIRDDGAKNESVYSGSVQGSRFTFPADATPLQFENCYTFSAQALGADGKTISKKKIQLVVIGEVESELFQKSEKSLEDIIDSFPDSPDGYAYLAKYYDMSGFQYNALNAFRKALERDPENSMFPLKIKSIEKMTD